MESKQLTGIVKWFNMKSGFGFIKSLDEEESRDVFVHHSALSTSNDQYHYLVEGEYVNFYVVEKEKDGSTRMVADRVTGILGHQLMCETRNVKSKKIKTSAEESV